jgi:DNA-directed RNA polymerase subunit RPC12/RpoP
MPRVETKTKNRAGSEYHCGRCGKKIEPGQKYRVWEFRYGGKHIRCDGPNCAPRESELTQGRMSEIYAITEGVAAACQAFRESKDIDNFLGEMESKRDDADNLRDEIDSAYEEMGPGLQQSENGQNAEARRDALDTFRDELDSAIDEARSKWEEAEESGDDRCDDCGDTEEDAAHDEEAAAEQGVDFHEFKAKEGADLAALADEIASEFEALSIDC